MLSPILIPPEAGKSSKKLTGTDLIFRPLGRGSSFIQRINTRLIFLPLGFCSFVLIDLHPTYVGFDPKLLGTCVPSLSFSRSAGKLKATASGGGLFSQKNQKIKAAWK